MRGPAMAPEPPTPSKLPMLYYGLVVVGTAALILLLYNLIVIKWCATANVGMDHRRQGPRQRRVRTRFAEAVGDPNLLSSFSYKKKEGGVSGRSSDYECVVCLSVFEEDEEVRRLPRCRHTFHVSCIDMWLYSHRDCPLCRAAAVPEGLIGSV